MFDDGRSPVIGFHWLTRGQAQSRIHTALYSRTACPAGIDDALQLINGRQSPVTLAGKTPTRLVKLIDELGLGRAIEIPGTRDAILVGGPSEHQILIMNRAVVGFLLPQKSGSADPAPSRLGR